MLSFDPTHFRGVLRQLGEFGPLSNQARESFAIVRPFRSDRSCRDGRAEQPSTAGTQALKRHFSLREERLSHYLKGFSHIAGTSKIVSWSLTALG